MATMAHARRSPGRSRHRELERLLTQQSTILHKRKGILRDGFPNTISGVVDDEERSLDSEEQSIGFSVLEFTSRTLQGIEAALERLSSGEAGICASCRSRISSARLRALPFASLCLGCQEQNDIAAVAVPGTATAGWRERVATTRLGSFGH